MSKVQAIIVSRQEASANVQKFGAAIKAALEELHSNEVSRQNDFSLRQDGVSEAIEKLNEEVQAVFDPICNAYDQIQLLAASMGVVLEDAEF
jgi:hypothetical protein